ncbi:hypothetical protein PHMEG_000540 [Phytophthora megakarya]|uniref:Uncharacterized protein n=1 Tax=Phytophthora megakarya TaxID=4795 RepID=A0A225X406_9STRA|nr:hypothetical protein PHMEG_000540 [Phytophthora megakarya]
MLSLFGAKDGFNKAACGKRCYNAVVKPAKQRSAPLQTGKKRVLWHNDDPSDDVSSLSVLIDWITSGDNYDRYRGGYGQIGETNTGLASQRLRLISVKAKKTREDALSSHPALLQLKKAQFDQNYDIYLADLSVRKLEFSLCEKEFVSREKRMESEERLAAARVGDVNPQAKKLQEEAEHWRQQRKIRLLRERENVLEEGVSQEEIDLLLRLLSQLEQVC